jgi:hypothetical protein
MSKISTYPQVGTPTLGDLLIGTDVSNDNDTKNFTIGDILALGGGSGGGPPFVPYIGATGDVDLGLNSLSGTSLYTNALYSLNGTSFTLKSSPSPAPNVGLAFDFTSNNIRLGNLDGVGLDYDYDFNTLSLGDYAGIINGTRLSIDDGNQFIYTSVVNDVSGIGIGDGYCAIGDIAEVINGVSLIVTYDTPLIYTKYNGDANGLLLNFDTLDYYLGDFSNLGSGTLFVVSDSSAVITTGIASSFGNFATGGLQVNLASNPIISIGDFAGTLGNLTSITLNDSTQRLYFSDNCAVEVYNGVGAEGQVLTSRGAAASPIWTNDVIQRMTTVERDAMAPYIGKIIYDTTANKVSVYDGTSWKYLMYE